MGPEQLEGQENVTPRERSQNVVSEVEGRRSAFVFSKKNGTGLTFSILIHQQKQNKLKLYM